MSTAVVRTAAPRPAAGAHRGLLPVVLTATFMTSLDVFVVNVALPSLQSGLGAGRAAVQWTVAGFALALAAGLVAAGRLGDRYGRRRVFALGLALFTAASAGCGLAPGVGVLVAARVLQGGAAALMGPQVLVILRTAYEGPAQARAFARYGLTMGVGAVLGQLIGGPASWSTSRSAWRCWPWSAGASRSRGRPGGPAPTRPGSRRPRPR
ncbi:MFS transporter [Kitasatospora sp. NPDC059571]|uniref:MFS transporter n=1 Tax=Kitasatospora sp. NPDC059571 TaxID=3346871 RepID=UPI00367C95E7